MKNVSKLIGLTLALSALFLTACKKKPIRPLDSANQMGTAPTNTIDPTAIAVDAAPGTGLENRGANTGTPADDNKSVVDPVYFALDRFAVVGVERAKVEAAAKWLKDNPDKSLVLVGHCDWRGTAEYNLGLGDRRANAVKKYLGVFSADLNRVETLSKGSTDAKQGGSDADWKMDRRVDFIVLKK